MTSRPVPGPAPRPDPGATAAPPRLAVLFWFYKAFALCRERVELLRTLNPGVPVYGLFGGAPEDAAAARAEVGPALDDLYVYEGGDAEWRWIHGDQVIAAWHDRRGRALVWDTLAVVQWDLLALAPLSEVLAGLRPGEAAFSGDRPLAEVADWWGWGGAGDARQNGELQRFRAYLSQRFGYAGPLWCCLFITAALPRAFLDRYVSEGPPGAGFLEYKLPTLARLFGTPVREVPQFQAWWRAEPATRDAPPERRVVNATREAIDGRVIADELRRPDGRRVFHPVFEIPEEVWRAPWFPPLGAPR